MIFDLIDYSTELLLNNIILNTDLGDTGKGRFTEVKRVKIEDLHPRQQTVCGGTLNYKMKGKGLTTAYVVIHKDGNILIDGHHSVIVKKLKGQKFVYAKCYIFNN